MILETIQEVQRLLPNTILLSSDKITQVGQYLSFNRFSKMNSKESLFEFKLYIAGYTLDKNAEGVLILCDEFINILQDNKTNAFLGYLASLILVDDVRLITHSEGLYVYAISFSVRLRI